MGRQIGNGHPATITVAVVVCDLCQTPYDYQVKEAEKKLEDECGGDFALVAEGLHVTKTGAYAMPVGSMVVAGDTTLKKYYWTARCGKAPTP